MEPEAGGWLQVRDQPGSLKTMRNKSSKIKHPEKTAPQKSSNPQKRQNLGRVQVFGPDSELLSPDNACLHSVDGVSHGRVPFFQTVYDQWFITLFNIVYTSLPVLAMGIFDQVCAFPFSVFGVHFLY